MHLCLFICREDILKQTPFIQSFFLNCSNGTSRRSFPLCLSWIWNYDIIFGLFESCSFSLVCANVEWLGYRIDKQTDKSTSWMFFVYVDELFSVSVLHLEMKHSLAKVVKQVVLIIYEWQIIPLAHVVIFMHAFIQICVAVNICMLNHQMYMDSVATHKIIYCLQLCFMHFLHFDNRFRLVHW